MCFFCSLSYCALEKGALGSGGGWERTLKDRGQKQAAFKDVVIFIAVAQ